MAFPLHAVQPSTCCGYGMLGTAMNGFDCLSIPGAAKATAKAKMLSFQRQCGRSAGLLTGTAGATIASKTVCSEY